MNGKSQADPTLRFQHFQAVAGQRGVEQRRDWRLLRAGLVGVDAVGLTLAVGSAGLLRLHLDEVLPLSTLATGRHLIASVLVIPVLLLLFRLQALYDFDQVLAGTREYARVAHAATYGVLIALAASFFAGGGPLISRSWILLVWALSVGFVCGGRFALRRIVRRLRRHGLLRTRVVIVGASAFGIAIAEQLQAAKHEGLDVVGFLDEYLPLGQPLVGQVGVVGRPGDLVQGMEDRDADEYILVPQALPYQRVEEITRLMVARAGPILRLAVSSRDLLTHGVRIAERGSVSLVTLRRVRITGLEAGFKRTLDVVGASVALLLLSLPMLLALLRTLLTGGRPRLTRHEIYAAGGERSTLWLLEPSVSSALLLRGVPALIGVLSGQLSLVGPRPTAWSDAEEAPPALWLTAGRPGLTGPWRLSGPAASLADQALLDLTYVRNYSVWEDLRILWESVRRLPGERRAGLLGRWQLLDAPVATDGAMQRAEPEGAVAGIQTRWTS